MIKAIFLDFYNTLVRFWPPLDQIQQASCREIGLNVTEEGINRGYAIADVFFNRENEKQSFADRSDDERLDFFSHYEQMILEEAGLPVSLDLAAQIWLLAISVPKDIVPYDDSLVTLFGLNIQVDGSYIIHQTMLELGNQSDLHTYFDQGHTPFSNNMDLETEFTKSFLYDFVCASEELSGDINFDGILYILDVVQLVNFILGEIPSNELFNISDMNGDEQLNVQDIILLINIILS